MTFYGYLCSIDSPRRHDVFLRHDLTREDMPICSFDVEGEQEKIEEHPFFPARFPREISGRSCMKATVNVLRRPLMTYALDEVFTLVLGKMVFTGCKIVTIRPCLDTRRPVTTIEFVCLACHVDEWTSYPPRVAMISAPPIVVYATDERHIAFTYVDR